MIEITKRTTDEGHVYEVANFEEYAQLLESHGIEAPRANYHVFVSSENESLYQQSQCDLESQIKLFFKVSPASGIESQIVEKTAHG